MFRYVIEAAIWKVVDTSGNAWQERDYEMSFWLSNLKVRVRDLAAEDYCDEYEAAGLLPLRDHTADFSLGSFRYTLERSELLLLPCRTIKPIRSTAPLEQHNCIPP
ncbi:hypothetical protein EVAR_70655_1 [Eumeta japonica]|uniref:Uncharacterized protein n=1 Tax=Eumeta variegata TaxID=151549 RepID=A0A4C1SJM6_EUMVA|nr:hypothetical protein EVAR_70655_1 [Eumeta japonica]